MKKAWNGWLMSKDTVLAEIKDSRLLVRNGTLMPLYFLQPEASLDGWLAMRSIDTGRKNSRLLRRALGLADADEREMVMRVNAAMITDTYWIREADQNLTWEDVRYRKNDFSDMALLGSFSDYGKPESRTPELTSTGSFEKCWRLENGVWWLYKLEDNESLFSEMAAFRLCERFGYDTAHYELADAESSGFKGHVKPGRGLIRTRDFTDGAAVNFEPAAALGLKSGDIHYNYERLKALGEGLDGQYLKILAMDVLVYNLDRHGQNFGVLRDIETGHVLSMAPNFDNNLSLLSGIYGMTERTAETDRLFREWKRLVQGNLFPLSVPELPEQDLRDMLNDIQCGVSREDVELAYRFIRQGYTLIAETAEQLRRFHDGLRFEL